MSEKVDLFVVQCSGPYRDDWRLMCTYDGAVEFWTNRNEAAEVAQRFFTRPQIDATAPLRARVVRILGEVVE